MQKKLLNSKGFNLAEICIALCVAGIVTVLGVTQFGAYMAKADKQSLHDSAKVFAKQVENCMKAIGGKWIYGKKKCVHTDSRLRHNARH